MGLMDDALLVAFSAEAEALVTALSACTASEWTAPTGCPPWTVAALAVHVEIACVRTLEMLDDPMPAGGALVDAAGYYRPDARFSAAENADRIRMAQNRAAALGSGVGVADALAATCSAVVTRCSREPADRVVVTRHGDPMLLGDFLVTRVFELVVHGLDLALALGREPRSADQALGVVLRLLLGDRGPDLAATLGLTPVSLLLKLTGRVECERDEQARLDALAPRRLTLG